MQITRESDYAVRIVVDLAGRPQGEVVRADDLGGSTGVPRPYLAKIIQVLSRAGFVQTRQGPRGGVILLKDPATVTLRQIVEAIEGPIYLNRCLIRPGECPRDSFCSVHPVWARIQAVLTRELDAVTAESLANAPVGSHHAQGGIE